MSANSVKEKPPEHATMSLRDTVDAAIARRAELRKLKAEVLSQAEEQRKIAEAANNTRRNLYIIARRLDVLIKE